MKVSNRSIPYVLMVLALFVSTLACGVFTPATPVPAEATQAPAMTQAPVSTDQAAAQPNATNWDRPFSTPNDTAWGDQQQYTLYHSTNANNTVLVMLHPGWSVDNSQPGTFDGEAIQSTDLPMLLAIADKFMADHPDAVKVWIGEDPQAGWNTDLPKFWTWTVFAYRMPKIQTPHAVWSTYDLPKDKKYTYCATPGTYVDGQTWNGSDIGTTTDFILTSGQITLPAGLHVGTIYVVTLNGDDLLVMARFMQMSFGEHLFRDKLLGKLSTVFFGDGLAPFGFSNANANKAWNYSPTCTQ